MADDVFAASRLTLARQRRRLTKKGLAQGIGVSGAAITAFENGSRSPSEETAERLAMKLAFPVAFFYGDEVEPIDLGISSFRSLRSMSARVRDAVLSAGTLAASVVAPYLEAKFHLPATDLPDIAPDVLGPASASQEVRDHWNLGQGPIPNILHLVESKGLHVYWIAEQSLTMDAISFWQDGRPYIILGADRCGERQRMNIAHEFGHLVLHRHRVLGDREAEREAFTFASSFLLPEGAFREYFHSGGSLAELFTYLFRAKRDWGVSVAAALRRCRDLELISENQYTRACQELSVRRWRKAEPNKLRSEESLLHRKVFERLRDAGMAPAEVARELQIGLPDLCELMPASERFRDADHDGSGGLGHLRLLS